MAVLWLDSFDKVELPKTDWFNQVNLPHGCLLKQNGKFETEILKCPAGYAIVQKGKYEWVQKGPTHWALVEKNEKEKAKPDGGYKQDEAAH